MAETSGAYQDSASGAISVKMEVDSRIQLQNLTAQATLKYSIKDYNAAADLYSQATELQADIYGELSTQNADLLYAYGRCLYHVAVRDSDVLGSKIVGEKREDGEKKPDSKKHKEKDMIHKANGQEQKIVEEVVTKGLEERDGPILPGVEADRRGKPYFQFIGDENFDTSDDEEEGEEEEDEEEEEAPEAVAEDHKDTAEEDDFVNAYEVLDLARVLLTRKLEEVDNSSGKGEQRWESQQVQQLKERLADTYDLQAEISLEGERFSNAVMDLKSALKLKKELFPPESSLVAEAHFKLSLALEFSSVTQQRNERGEVESNADAHVDELGREEAAREMEAAIASCRMRIKKEEALLYGSLGANGDSGKSKVTKGDIADVKAMVGEMEQRLVELRQPSVSINDSTGMGTIDGSNPLSGILGSILGETPATQKARLEEASKGAKDLTKLIRRKKRTDSEASKASEPRHTQNNGKRKVDFGNENEDEGIDKRARIADSVDK